MTTLYIYMPSSTRLSRVVASLHIQNIYNMTHMGFLPKDATVWVSSRTDGAGMWVLAEKSTHVRIVNTINAGWARMTRSTVKLGSTFNAAVKEPSSTFSLEGVPSETRESQSSTILVNHAESGKRMQFVADSKIIHGVTDGKYTFDPFTVIDLPNYKTAGKATTDKLQIAHATLNGTALMCSGLDDETAAFVKSNIDVFAIPLQDNLDDAMKTVKQLYDAFTSQWVGEIEQRIRDRGGDPEAMGRALEEPMLPRD